ncbi:SMI1/KNR4 family protein [Flavobacterium frigoris]|uniref:SMI1 / KNR4 family (SUKH-1) n=1 Tax=Flavobacterium frigoris TaxID=229204 RepID=A0A1H9RZI8_FLAFI|nr:SMI1/KNR4 family protein [Flavobacterium frigoris]SER77289.1 SMI1 / KNR4 family (SUKH-1) [Flavobacterium frigoris]
MRHLTIDSSFIPLNKDEIELFELANNVVLPNYLKDFFVKYNGAKILEAFYGDQYYISFLPLLKNRNASVELILPAVRDEEEGIGRNDLIPFATDPGGRPFYVSIGSNDEGVIYYDLVGLGDDEPLRKITNSFEEFINGLKTEEEAL